MILITLGGGVVAAVVLNKTKAQNAGWMVITTGWAFAVMAGIYTARAVGAPGYINPVGPLAGVLTANLAMDKALAFAAAELAGAFVGGVIVWLHYLPHWRATTDAGAKLAVFCTTPAIRDYPANVLSEAIATFVLVFVGTAVVEKGLGGRILDAPLGGALVWGIGLSLGATTGYAINPARDLGPRLAHALLPIAGKGGSDWAYAWVPVVGPLIGGAAGALFAKAVIAQ
jgi:glycerol uptake facilitator protein